MTDDDDVVVGVTMAQGGAAPSIDPPSPFGSTVDITLLEQTVEQWRSKQSTVDDSSTAYIRTWFRFFLSLDDEPAPVWNSFDEAVTHARGRCSDWTAEQFWWWTTNVESWNVPRFLDMVGDELSDETLAGVCYYAWRHGERPELFVPHARWRELFRRAGYTIDGMPATRPGTDLILYRGCTAAGRVNWSWSTKYWVAQTYAEYCGGSVFVALVPPEQLLAGSESTDIFAHVVDTQDRTRRDRSIQIRSLDLAGYVRDRHWPHCRVDSRGDPFSARRMKQWEPTAAEANRCLECGALISESPPVRATTAGSAFFEKTGLTLETARAR